MKILLLEPYFTGSHKSWAEGYQSSSAHEIQIISLPGFLLAFVKFAASFKK